MTFTGTVGDVDLNGKTVTVGGNTDSQDTNKGNVDIDGGTGDVGGFRFHNGTDYDMSSGVFDMDDGLLTLDGTSGNHLEIDDLDFNLATSVTGTAVWCDVVGSVNTYVTSEIDATSNCSDDTGNTGWDFGAAGNAMPMAIHHYKMAGGL